MPGPPPDLGCGTPWPTPGLYRRVLYTTACVNRSIPPYVPREGSSTPAATPVKLDVTGQAALHRSDDWAIADDISRDIVPAFS
jgi:hypothetical protein